MRLPRFLALCWLVAVPARAAIYENTITIDDEDDLFTLQQRGDISDATLDTLLEVYREGVELNSATRDQLYDLPGITYQDVDAILEYRKAKGRIDDPAELVGAGAITADQLLQAAPFIRVLTPDAALPVSGKVRAVSMGSATDTELPPAFGTARIKGPFDLTAGGMLTTTRRAIATPRYDPIVDSLVSKGYSYQLQVPRAYLAWMSGKRKVVLGTFTLGFAERLVLDNTKRFTPYGIYLTDDFRRPQDLSTSCRLSGALGDNSGDCLNAEGKNYITPDFQWREVFRGVAASVEELSLGDKASLSMYGFLSYQGRRIYQYELYDRRFCDDPRNDNDANCAAPRIYLDEGATTGGTRISFSSLLNMYDELASGGHAAVVIDGRTRIGVTGYGAATIFDTPFRGTRPMELDFQEWSRIPGGGSFGALGVNFKTTWENFNFFGEVARSFDRSVGGGGGFAVEQRTTWSPKGQELELSLRYYDNKYANPYARPISGPDETDGQRASNELGARVRYFRRFSKDWEWKARVDVWTLPFTNPSLGPAGMTNLYGLTRVDFNGWDFFMPAFWVDVRNRNLASNQRGRCASGSIVVSESAEDFACNGDLYRVAARVDSKLLRRNLLNVSVQGWVTWADDVKYSDKFRNDFLGFVEVRSQPVDFLQLRLKSRYVFQDLSDNRYLEQSWWTFVEAAWLVRKGTRLSARYDAFVWLDDRDSTKQRVPYPVEHRFLIDLRTSF